jgi:hypothetical protein
LGLRRKFLKRLRIIKKYSEVVMVEVIAEATGRGRWLRGNNEETLGQLIKRKYFGRLEEFNIEYAHKGGQVSFSAKACLEVDDFGDDPDRTADLMLKRIILPSVFDDLEVLS